MIGLVRPEMLWLLLIVPLAAVLAWRAARARALALRVFAGPLALTSRSPTRSWLKAGLLLLALTAVIVALADPFVDLRTRYARRLGVDIVLAIDVSQSMAARDVPPDRLRAARRFAQVLGEEMVGSRVSLVLFAGESTVRYPATTDPRILGEVLDSSGTGVRLLSGTSLRSGLDAALGAFGDTADARRRRVVVLVSDGETTLGSAPELSPFTDRGVLLYTVGVGTPEGAEIPTYSATDGAFTGYLAGPDGRSVVSRLDEDALRTLASAAGGSYLRYTGDDGAVRELGTRLRALEAIEEVQDPGSVPDERAQLFLAVAVAALLAARFLDDRRGMPSPLGAAPAARRRGRGILGALIGTAMLWGAACGDQGVSNEAANQRFAAADYAGALEMYRALQREMPDAPELGVNAGNALHMLGQLEDALPEYARAIDTGSPEVRPIAQYDRGNTLFRLGRLQDARDAYREALRLDPTDRDAKLNLELLMDLLAPRPSPSSGPAGRSPGPGGSGAPAAGGGSPGSSAQPGASAPPRPGASGEPNRPSPGESGSDVGEQAPDLEDALTEFRRGLTLDDALRVLDALRADQRGIGQLLEGQRRAEDRQY